MNGSFYWYDQKQFISSSTRLIKDNIDQSQMLAIDAKVTGQNDKVEVRVTRNSKQIFHKVFTVHQLKRQVQKSNTNSEKISASTGIGQSLNGCNLRGQKIPLQFADIYLGPDSTLQLCMKSPINQDNLIIYSGSRIYIANLHCNKLVCKCETLRFYGDNSCKQNVQFYYVMNKMDKEIYAQQGFVSTNAGNLLVAQNSRLEANVMIVSAGVEVRLDENSQLKFCNTKLSVFKAQRSTIYVDFQAKLYCQNNMTLFVQKIVNKGYISTTNQKNGVIFIQNKMMDNFGHIKVPSLVLMTQTLKNHSEGQITVYNGKIIVNKQLQNKGQLMIPSVTVGFNQQNSNRAKIANKGQLLCRSLLAQSQYFINSGSICCEQVRIQGKYQKNLLKNESVIQCSKLQLLNMIFLNTNTGYIVSTGELQIFIEGWINCGEVQNKSNMYSAVKGSIFNKGCFKLNDGVISAKNVKNDSKISAHKQLMLNVKDVFVNAPQSSIEMPRLVILGKKVRNLGKIEVDQLDIQSEMLTNEKSGKISADTVNSFGKYSYNSGQINFKRVNMKADKLHNDGAFNTNAMNFQGGYVKNQSKMNVNSGKFNTKLNYSDTPEAQGTFKNVQMHTSEDPVFFTQGTLKMENVRINQSIKYFFNKKQVDFDKVELKLDGFSVKDLKLKDTHITFTTLKQEKDGKIYSLGGYNGLHEIERRNSAPLHENQFQIDILSEALYRDLQIVCENNTEIAVGSINPYLNGWNLLTHPIGVGQFSKRISTKKFDIPGNIYDVNMKAKNFKKVTKLSPHLYEKYYTHQIPNSGQKQLTIQTDHLLLGGRFKYSGQKLSINVPNLDLKIGSIEVPDGILQVNTQQAMIVTHAYMQAKGIELRSGNQISVQASKFCAAASGLLMDASKIVVLPTIQKKHTESYSANGKVKWVNDWEEGCRAQFHVQGSIIIRADQYIQMIAPYIKAKQKLTIASPNTHIQGLFLYKNCDTFVKKKKTFGGSKTNQYGQRNDRPFPAFLQAEQIQFSGNAKVNATFKAKKIIDLTQNGLHLFYVVGYSGSFQNRQFSNFFTQGVQGYSHTRQKFLKANLSQVQMIIRDRNLSGQIIFDTVEWGKIRPIIQAKYKQLIAIPKQWYTSWQHESLGVGVIMVISMIAAYAGANIVGPALVSMAGVAKAGIAAMAIKSSAAVICQKFAVTLAVTGNLGAAFKSVFSFDTVISAAINFGLDFAMMKLAKPLGISLVDKGFANILKKKFLQFTLSSAASVLQGEQIGKSLLSGVKHMMASLVAEVGGNHIGSNYGFKSGFDYFIHKALHAALGAVQGLIIGGNANSAISGAVGALVAQIVIQALVDRNDIEKAHRTSDNPQEMFQIQKLVAKIFGGVAGGLCGNFQVAMLTAVNAIHYNFETQLQAQLEQMQKDDDPYTKQMKKKKLQKEINQMLVEDARDVVATLLSYEADQILSYQLYQKQMDDQGTAFYKIDPAKIQNGLRTKLDQYKQKFKHLKLDSYEIMFDPNVSYSMMIQGFSMKSQKQKKIFVGIAGSKNKHDFLVNDNKIIMTGKPLQTSIQETRQYIRNIAQKNPSYDIKVTGHSLGGHLAELALLALEGQYKNISVTSFNAFHGFFRDINKDIVQNPKIKRFRMKNQWPLKHPIDKFKPIIDAAKVGYNPKLSK